MALDQPEGRPEPCKRPEPRPPRKARPRDLTVTEVEMLVRDPYAVYAKKVLDLRPLEGIDADPGLPERGQIIHDVLEQFVNLPPSGRDPVAALRELGRQHFARHAQAPEVMALWWPRFEAVAIWFCAQHRQRQEEIARLGTELEGSLSVDASSGSYRIRTRADRVEVRRDGSLAILDYKTGTLPSGAEVRAGLRPQLVLEALIAAGGGFPGIPAIVPAELLYWGLKGSEDNPGRGPRPARQGLGRRADHPRAGVAAPAHGPLRRPEHRLHPRPPPRDRARAWRLRAPGAGRRVARRRRRAVSGRVSPTPAQRRAADPDRSVWVTANAGTGKTRVLSDRVLRLLLAGARPDAILCLTFTKAAAAEMGARIERQLAAWAVARDEKALAAEIEELTGEPPSPRTLRDARRLFARVLDLPRGLGIMTIHALCQALLKRFPLEAGVAPHFETIDDRTASELMAEARAAVLTEGCRRDDRLARAVEVLAVTLAETSLSGAVEEMLARRHRLAACFARHHPGGHCDGLLAHIERRLDVEPGLEPPQLLARACEEGVFDHAGLLDAANAMARAEGKTDSKHGRIILRWLTASPGPAPRLPRGVQDRLPHRRGRGPQEPVQQGPERHLPARAGRRAGAPAAPPGQPERARPLPPHGRPAAPRPRRHPRVRAPEAPGCPARLRRPDRAHRPPAGGPRPARLGALQARPAARARPGRRGAGHEPAPVGHRREARPRSSWPASGRIPATAPSSSSATRSSRSTASRVPTSRTSAACGRGWRSAPPPPASPSPARRSTSPSAPPAPCWRWSTASSTSPTWRSASRWARPSATTPAARPCRAWSRSGRSPPRPRTSASR